MSSPIPRRQFLKTASIAVTGPLVLGVKAKSAPESAAPSASPRLLVGCCAYSYGKHLKSGQMTMEDFILKGVELGVNGVDITTYWLKSTEPAYLAALRRLAFKNAMPFSGAASATNMGQADPAQRREELEKIQRWVDTTELLGAAHLRVFGGELPPGATLEQGIQWVAETMKPACDYAAKKGITLGLENHHGITAKAATILEILRRVDSPSAGLNLDISNYSDDPYAEIEASVPYATHAHVRDVFTKSRQPIDLERVWQLFARGGYRGYMSAEYEGTEDSMTGVPKLIARMKSLSAKYSSV